WYLIWTWHHILMDAWSSDLVFTEVTDIYRALINGAEPQLNAVAPYEDFIRWWERQDLNRAHDYWADALKHFFEPTPINWCKRPIHRSQATAVSIRFTGEETERLRACARRSRVTLNTVLQGAWALLLSRYSGEGDVVFGNVVSGRPPELPGV